MNPSAVAEFHAFPSFQLAIERPWLESIVRQPFQVQTAGEILLHDTVAVTLGPVIQLGRFHEEIIVLKQHATGVLDDLHRIRDARLADAQRSFNEDFDAWGTIYRQG